MADRGVIFSAAMVRALLDGRKVQTRRLLKRSLPPEDADVVRTWFAPPEIPAEGIPNQWAQSGLWAVQHVVGGEDGEPASGGYNRYCGPLPYRPGDRLYVREAWATVNSGEGPGWAYRADGQFIQPEFDGEDFGAGPSFSYEKYPGEYCMWYSDLRAGAPDHRWTPSIHQPRWASRLTLLVTEVRVQRVAEINWADAVAEGMTPSLTPLSDFADLWNSLHDKPGERWEDSPWVVAVTFTVHRGNIDRIDAA